MTRFAAIGTKQRHCQSSSITSLMSVLRIFKNRSDLSIYLLLFFTQSYVRYIEILDMLQL